MIRSLPRGARVTLPLVLALLVSLSLRATPSWAAAVDEVHYTFTGPTSVALNWRGDATDVRYGPTNSYGQTATGTASAWTPWSSPGPFRQVEITGLVPGAAYHYSIGGGPDWTFLTPPSGDLRFDAVGDLGDTVNSAAWPPRSTTSPATTRRSS